MLMDCAWQRLRSPKLSIRLLMWAVLSARAWYVVDLQFGRESVADLRVDFLRQGEPGV